MSLDRHERKLQFDGCAEAYSHKAVILIVIVLFMRFRLSLHLPTLTFLSNLFAKKCQYCDNIVIVNALGHDNRGDIVTTLTCSLILHCAVYVGVNV